MLAYDPICVNLLFNHFNAKRGSFQLYHGENKLHSDGIMTMSYFYWTNILSWIYIVLAHWNNNPRVEMTFHLDTLFWFSANQYFLLLLSAKCLAKKEQILFGMTRPGLEPTIYRTPRDDTNHYTIDALNYWHKFKYYFLLNVDIIYVCFIGFNLNTLKNKRKQMKQLRLTHEIEETNETASPGPCIGIVWG